MDAPDEEVEEVEDDEGTHDDADELTEDTVKGWITEAISAALSGTKTPEGDGGEPAEPVTLRQVEEAARRQVEEAMKKIQPKKTAAKKKPAAKKTPEPEPERSPAENVGSRLRKALWGD